MVCSVTLPVVDEAGPVAADSGVFMEDPSDNDGHIIRRPSCAEHP
jgi:hypothetical protein